MLKLISFTTCPFVQRAVLMLKHKGVDFEIEYIDLRDKPEWFLKLSPRGKVPIVVVGDEVLFESQAIVEYLDETNAPRLAPEDPIERARDRAWFAMTSEDLLMPTWKLESANDDEKLAAAVEKVKAGWKMLDDHLAGREWISGDGSRFGLADVGAAPPAWRARWFRESFGLDLFEGLDNVRAWSERLHKQPALAESVPESWEADLKMFMESVYKSALLNQA